VGSVATAYVWRPTVLDRSVLASRRKDAAKEEAAAGGPGSGVDVSMREKYY